MIISAEFMYFYGIKATFTFTGSFERTLKIKYGVNLTLRSKISLVGVEGRVDGHGNGFRRIENRVIRFNGHLISDKIANFL